MITVEIVGLDRTRAKVERLWSRLKRVLKQVVRRQSRALTQYVKTRHLTGGTTSDRLAVRSGHLRRSTKPRRVSERDGQIVGGVEFGARYASVHVGPKGKRTTIRPKSAQYLAIPLAAAKTAAGVARGGPRDYPDSFVVRTKAGNLLVMGRQTGAKGAVPLFVLKRQVVVPARVHPEDIERVLKPRILKDIQAEFERLVGG